MTRFSHFIAVLYIFRGITAVKVDHSFTLKLVTAGQDYSTECSLVDIMELNVRLASSFESNGRKFFHKRVVLEDFTEVKELENEEQGSDDGSRELFVSNKASFAKAKDSNNPTQGMLRRQTRHERQLGLIYKIYSGVGAFSCRLCPSDNKDRQLSDKTSLHSYMSKYMTKDIKAYSIRKSLNGTTSSCYGDKESILVEFALIE
jgi:hypothetical protein